MKPKIILFLSFPVAMGLLLFGTPLDLPQYITGTIAPENSNIEPFFANEKRLSPNDFTAFWPTMAVNNKDEIMVVYMEEGGTRDIYYRISTDGGENWTPHTRTNSVNLAGKAPELAADSDGNFHVVYADGGSSAQREIYYRAYITEKDKWQPRERLSFSVGNAQWPTIDVDDDTVYIAWYEELGGNQLSRVHLKSKKVGGTWPSTPEDASRDSQNGHLYPDMKVKDGNIYYIHQVHQYEAGEVVTKYIAFKEKINGVWQDTVELGKWAWPDIEVDDYDNIHCLFPNKGKAIYRARIGSTWGGQSLINTKSSIDGFFDLEYRNNTLVSVFAMDNTSVPSNVSNYLRVKKYNNGWGAWGDPYEIRGGEADLPQMGIDSQGYAHLVWADWGGSAEEVDAIWYNKYKVGDPESVVPSIELNKSSLSFEVTEGDNPESQTFEVRNSGAGTLNFQVSSNKNWMTVSPSSGSATKSWTEITVDISASSLTEGTYTGTIEVSASDADNSPQTLEVTLTILPPPPSLELDKTSLSFKAYEGESPESKTFKVRNIGGGTLNYQINKDKNWMALFPTNGTSKGKWNKIEVAIYSASLNTGTYTGTIEVSSNNADNSPKSVKVTLIVKPIPINAPLNFTVEKIENNSFLLKELIHHLQWEANPENKNIVKYIITCDYKVNGTPTAKVYEFNSDVFEHYIRRVLKNIEYSYSLKAVDNEGRTGPAVVVTVQ